MWERGHRGRVTGDSRQTTSELAHPIKWMTRTCTKGLPECHVDPWQPLDISKSMDDILSPHDRPPTPSYLCSWAPPRRDRTYRTTLCEPLEFTISLSHHIADAPQAIPLKHFSIKWMEGFLAIIIVENYAWLIKQQQKNAGFLTQYLELKKAPNTHKTHPPTAVLGYSWKWFPPCLLAKLIATGIKHKTWLTVHQLPQELVQHLCTCVTASVCRAAECSGPGNLIQVKNTVYFLGPSYF